ncbi:hypothetical protein ELQ35_13750 [Peribacillus cavernae]|uniref:Uncharacterized protein n=1 Tax=Peribacillus cavernae TaxID=1674310 RepID=A0A3S0VHV4_9BACI|nr:hypothetical protein [Peribacillus cavernae]RUQ28284.1 hypothetical protein ELQ35_13750 [Peribacillus cavernae]
MPRDMGGYVIISDAEIHSASYTTPSLQPYLTSSDRVAYPPTVRESLIFKIMLVSVSKNIFLTPLRRVKPLINQYL